MTFHDVWDFDPNDVITGGRSLQGELKTRFAKAWLPGQGFKVRSFDAPFTQGEADATVVWAGGTPTFVPDRIAATDTAIANPKD